MDAAIWAVIVAAVTLLVLVTGGLAAIVQAQLNAISKLAEIRAECLNETIQNVDKDINRIRDELLIRRKEFFHRDEFEIFKATLNDRWNAQYEINRQAVDAYLSIKAWNAWKGERDIRSLSMEQSIKHNGGKNGNGSSS